MTYKPYKKEKEEFDNQVFSYLMKRVFDNFDETNACHENIIDGIGNIVNQPKPSNQWAYTMLDQFINMIKINIGVEELRDIFIDYMDMYNIDPLFIIKNRNIDYSKYIPLFSSIVTKVNDKSYLPEHLYHEESYVEQEEGFNFCDQISRALTILSYLLYTLRYNRIIVGVDFSEVLESVESTFNICAYNDYEYIKKYCLDNKLITTMGISNEGIRLLVKCAKELTDGNIYSDCKEKHNLKDAWKKLSGVK